MKKAVLLSITTVAVLASGLDDFVDNALNVQTNRPGYYQSQTRGVFSLGDLRVRTNTSPNIRNPIHVEAPRLAIGCGGIDIGLGGFSFIADPDQLVEKLQAMSGAAAGYAFKMALSTLCKDCDAILSELEKFADMINGLNFDGCQSTQKLGSAFAEAVNLNLDAGHDNAFNRAVSEAKNNLAQTRTRWESTLTSYMGDSAKAKEAVKDITLQGSFIKKAVEKYQPTTNFGTVSGSNLFEGIMRAILGDIVGYTSQQPNMGSKTGGGQTGNFKYTYVQPLYTSEDFKNFLVGGEIPYTTVQTGADDVGMPLISSSTTNFNGVINYFQQNIDSIYNKMIIKADLSTADKEFLGSLPLPIYRYLNALVMDGGGKKDDVATYLAILETQALMQRIFKDITYTVFAYVASKSSPIEEESMKGFHRTVRENLEFYETALNEFLQTESSKLQAQVQTNNYYEHNTKALKQHLGSSNIFGNYMFAKGLAR